MPSNPEHDAGPGTASKDHQLPGELSGHIPGSLSQSDPDPPDSSRRPPMWLIIVAVVVVAIVAMHLSGAMK